MGITKSAVFTDEQNKLANLFKALGNPARLAIIAYLIKQESCICGQIVDEIPLAQPTISQHLKELKAVGLIKEQFRVNRFVTALILKIFN